jgi:phosphoglycerate dehydrogenase-like enzyme
MTRLAAVLAMRRKIAEQALDADTVERLRRAVDVDPELVLDDFTSPVAKRALADTEILFTGWGCPPIDRSVLALTPRLRAIVHSAGTVRHHVTDACWERGIEVSSAAAANAVPVAEYTVAMILLANKRIPDMARIYREQRREIDWDERYPGAGNYRRTVGILSASQVGRRVIELLRPYELDVRLHDPYVSTADADELGVRTVSLAELFRANELVSVHTPLLPTTRGLVSRELLASMPAGSTLINTSRGAVIDQDALVDEVRSGRIHAVLDVTEPDILPADSPLFDCDNVVLTPHVAGSKGGEVRRLMSTAVDEVERFVQGKGFRYPVRREELHRMA